MVLQMDDPLPKGLYEDNFGLGNLYTVLRGNIHDFGVIGSFMPVSMLALNAIPDHVLHALLGCTHPSRDSFF